MHSKVTLKIYGSFLLAKPPTREARLAVDNLDVLQVHNRHPGRVTDRRVKRASGGHVDSPTMVCAKCEKTLSKTATTDPFVRVVTYAAQPQRGRISRAEWLGGTARHCAWRRRARAGRTQGRREQAPVKVCALLSPGCQVQAVQAARVAGARGLLPGYVVFLTQRARTKKGCVLSVANRSWIPRATSSLHSIPSIPPHPRRCLRQPTRRCTRHAHVSSRALRPIRRRLHHVGCAEDARDQVILGKRGSVPTAMSLYVAQGGFCDEEDSLDHS